MRMRKLLPLALVAAPLLAGGEYDRVHYGFHFGVAWSPNKSIGVLGSEAPASAVTADSAMQFAGAIGFQVNFAAVPGRLNLGLVVDDLLPVNKETGTQSVPNGKVSQNTIRTALKIGFASRGNTNEGTGFWIAPTYSFIRTHDDLLSLNEKKFGGAIGFTGRSFAERHIAFWDVGIFYVPKLSSGTKAGDTTLEIKVGWLF